MNIAIPSRKALPMFPAPNLFALWKAPLSGDILQNIEPRLFSDDMAGSPDIEEAIFKDVASYGAQLGKILEALETLSAATDTPLPAIHDLRMAVETKKAEMQSKLAERATTALDKLKAADPAAHAALLRGRATEGSPT
jgi:hypothetical protein